MKKVFTKHRKNPLLTAADMPEGIMYLMNPGAVKYKGEYILMMDAATLGTPIVFWLARSRDGVNFNVDKAPLKWPAWSGSLVETCVYDPRITKFDDEYIIMYASQAPGRGVRPGIVKTRDFETFERVPQAETELDNRNAVLFPEKINGRYIRFDRPMLNGETGASNMCISYSKDLSHWEETKPLMDTRPGMWDGHKIGAGAVPIKTDKGWLAIYHGVDSSGCNGFIYRLGVIMLDLDDPSKIISRGELPVLWPSETYEIAGRVSNVTFTCNAVLENDNTVKVYYGAADTCIGLAEAKLDDLTEACFVKNEYLNSFFLNT